MYSVMRIRPFGNFILLLERLVKRIQWTTLMVGIALGSSLSAQSVTEVTSLAHDSSEKFKSVDDPTLTDAERQHLESATRFSTPLTGPSQVSAPHPRLADPVVSEVLKQTNAFLDSYRAMRGESRSKPDFVKSSGDLLGRVSQIKDMASQEEFVYQVSRLLDYVDRQTFLTEALRRNPAFREFLKSELFRIVASELIAYGAGSKRELETLDPTIVTLLTAKGALSDTRQITQSLLLPTYDLDFRVTAVSLLASCGDDLSRFKQVTFLLDLARIAAPEGTVVRHIYGIDGYRSVILDAGWFPKDPGREVQLRVDIGQATTMLYMNRSIVDLLRKYESLARRLDEAVKDIEVLKRRVARNEAGINDLQRAVVSLESRVNVIEAWQDTVEDRLGELELRVDLIEAFGAKPSGIRMPAAEDRDRDLIDDRVEHLLIQALAPCFKLQGPSRPPCSAKWFIQHSFLREPGDDPDSASPQQWASWIQRRDLWKMDAARFLPYYSAEIERISRASGKNESDAAHGFRIQLASESFRSGRSDIGMPTSWDAAQREGNVGMYAHVVRGDRPGDFVVQYFMLLCWNETAYSFGVGNHEADWLTVTFLVSLPEYSQEGNWEKVDQPVSKYTEREWQSISAGAIIKSDRKNPTQARDEFKAIGSVFHDPALFKRRIVWARMINHGRYIDVAGRNLEWEETKFGTRVVLYMENGTNELWPNSGDRGYGGWPASNESGRISATKRVDWRNGPDATCWQRLQQGNAEREGWPNFRDGKHFEGHGWGPVGYSAFFRPAWENRSGGFRISYDFGGGEDGDELNEHKTVREHRGEAGEYVTRDVPNLGEVGYANGVEAQILLSYGGLWGGWWKGNSSPDGPVREETWVMPDTRKKDGRKEMTVEKWLESR
jgi:hypothetical protein